MIANKRLLTGPPRVFAAGTHSKCGRTAVLDSWGNNSAGELGDGALIQSPLPVAADTSAAGTATVPAVSAGRRHDLGLLSNGTVLTWGDDTFGPTPVRKAPFSQGSPPCRGGVFV